MAARARSGGEWDVVVCGAGPAGLCAAIAASRAGARCLLLERHGFAGGMSTAALVYPWMTFHDREGNRVIGGLAQEIVDRLWARRASPGHLRDTIGFVHSLTPFEPHVLRVLVDEMLTEAGCKVLYHALLCAVKAGAGSVHSVTVQTPAERIALRARALVDATGDATLCHHAGVPMQDDTTGRDVQPMTMCFRLSGVDLAAVATYIAKHPEEFHETTMVGHRPLTGVSGFFRHWREAGLPIPRDRLLFFAGIRADEVYMNTSRIQGLDGTVPEDLTEAEREGRRQVDVLCRFVRSHVPGFRHAYLSALPTQVGVRETRRVVGEYTMTGDHVRTGARFDDAIARGAFPIDIHSPTGAGIAVSEQPPGAYDIPYRCLIPRDLSNTLVAGRCISATHEGHASTRLTPVCMAMGESAGRAAAWVARTQRDTREWPDATRMEDSACPR